MICHFPTPYPDELLYSVCARYSDRMQYSSTEAVSKDLFGRLRSVNVALPNGLGNLISNLAPKYNYTATNLINNHTLLPLYEPFLPSNRSNLIKNMMEADKSKSIPILLGIRNRAIPTESVQFCLHCVEEDRKKYSECYWHRIHQIPGVEICPVHNVYLQMCDIMNAKLQLT